MHTLSFFQNVTIRHTNSTRHPHPWEIQYLRHYFSGRYKFDQKMVCVDCCELNATRVPVKISFSDWVLFGNACPMGAWGIPGIGNCVSWKMRVRVSQLWWKNASYKVRLFTVWKITDPSKNPTKTAASRKFYRQNSGKHIWASYLLCFLFHLLFPRFKLPEKGSSSISGVTTANWWVKCTVSWRTTIEQEEREQVVMSLGEICHKKTKSARTATSDEAFVQSTCISGRTSLPGSISAAITRCSRPHRLPASAARGGKSRKRCSVRRQMIPCSHDQRAKLTRWLSAPSVCGCFVQANQYVRSSHTQITFDNSLGGIALFIANKIKILMQFCSMLPKNYM